jgi:hypothetical protein
MALVAAATALPVCLEAGRRLDFDIHPDAVLLAERGEIGEQRHRLALVLAAEPAAGVHAGQFSRVVVEHLAGAGHGTAEIRVVHHHRHAVARQHDVEFDRAKAVRQAAHESRDRIFRGEPAPPRCASTFVGHMLMTISQRRGLAVSESAAQTATPARPGRRRRRR